MIPVSVDSTFGSEFQKKDSKKKGRVTLVMKTSADHGAVVEIPLTEEGGLSSQATADMPIIVHREFHDETNMKRIRTS